MIQVLGLRDYVYQGVPKKREVFFNKGWRFDKVEDVFNPAKLQVLIDRIPEDVRFNLYFTVADCYEEPGRKLKEQWAIPFDIDNLELVEGHEHEAAERAARLASQALGVPYDDMAVVFTGNGVQFFIVTDSPIIDEEYFERTRDHYNFLCKKIQNMLIEHQVQGTVDSSVWSKARLMRLAMTLNRKPNRPERMAYLLKGEPKARRFDVVEQSGLTLMQGPEVMADAIIKNYPKPDTKAICSGCKFLVYCKENPARVSEPQWYAMTSITARLDDGRNLTHEYSQGHPSYNHYETENKIDQALAAAGPRTCKDIEGRWDGCSTCDYYGKVTSPIMIKGPDYIASRDFGFRERKQVGEGNAIRVIAGRPVYTDLIKEFGSLHPYKVVVDNDQVVVFNGKHWGFLTDRAIRAWMTSVVRHEPNAAEMAEFIAQLKAYNITSLKELYQQRDGLMNFQNCVLNMQTGETVPHNPRFGFFDVRPYAYDPRATAPMWEQFLKDIMADDAEMSELLKEFGGYAISGDQCWIQKALLMVGDGANGKSVYMEILGEVVGEDSHSAVAMQDLEKDTLRYQLVNKLFNYSEETSMRALSDSSLFKTLVSGGLMNVKQLYSQPFLVANKAKVLMSANTMPYSMDRSGGLLRRLAIIHFDVKFTPGDGKHDYFIKDKLRAELPGICNSLIAAYKNLRERGRLIGEAKVMANVRRYQEESDTVLMFINESVFDEPEAEVAANELYDDYRRMCENSEFRPMNKIQFGRLFTKHKGLHTEVVKRNGAAVRVYRGVTNNKGF